MSRASTPKKTPPSEGPEIRLTSGAQTWNQGALIFAMAGLALLIASLSIFKMSNNDIWIHLTTGRQILQTWQVPDKDPYSFTASDHDYVAHEWLSGVLFHIMYAIGGVNALIFFKSAIIFATCAALWGACLFRRDDPLILFPCFALMLFIGSARFLERPHIFSYLFEALYLLCYFGYREGGRNRKWLYAIPLLHVLWTNLHGGHYQGVFLLVMLAAAEVVMYLRARWLGLAVADAIPLSDLRLICALPFACLATAFLNPYGYRLLTFPFELTGQEIFMKGIYEWQSALFPSYNLSSMFLYYIIWIAVLFGSFLAVRGHDELSGVWRTLAVTANIILAILWLVFIRQFARTYLFPSTPAPIEVQAPFWYVVVALFLAANLHRLQFQHAGIAALFFALSMRHNRGVTDAAVATLPSLSANLNAIRTRLMSGRTFSAPVWLRPAALTLMGTAMFYTAGWTFTHSYYFGFKPPSTREMGLGIAGNMPIGAVDYVERNGITGNCFPSYNAAAPLIHRMWPKVRVAMDSRNDVYGETLYREYVAALNGGRSLETYLSKWPVDFFLMTYGSDRNPEFFKSLDKSPDWKLVYFDDRSVVYLKRTERFKAIIDRDGYDLISPAIPGAIQVTPETASRWLAEAERAVAAAPDDWSPWQYKAKALLQLDRLDESEAATRRMLSINPRAYYAWADLGYLHMLKNDPAAAESDFIKCLTLRPDYVPCRQALDQLRSPTR